MNNEVQVNETMTAPEGTICRPRMKFWEAVKTCWGKYAVFTGRARRSEYWWFSLFYLLIVLIPVFSGFFTEILSDLYGNSLFSVIAVVPILLGLLAMFVLLIPCFSVQTRRLHDTGNSGWWIVWSLIVSAIDGILPFTFLGQEAAKLGEFQIIRQCFDVSLLAGLSVTALSIASMALGLIILIFSIMDSQKGENKYGLSPKYQ